jgi:hypothetical protein
MRKELGMTKNERLAKLVADDILMDIYGYENVMMDNPEDSVEYQETLDFLSQPIDDLVEEVVLRTMSFMTYKKSTNQGKFAGNEFLRNYVKKELVEFGIPFN